MSLSSDEQRALDWQATQIKRRASQRALQAKLRAPSGPAAQTKRNWAPVTRTGEIKGSA